MSWEQVEVPMRIIKMVRTTERDVTRGGEKRTETEVIERWIATTMEQGTAGTDTVSRIAGARWNIENTGFHDMKTYTGI